MAQDVLYIFLLNRVSTGRINATDSGDSSSVNSVIHKYANNRAKTIHTLCSGCWQLLGNTTSIDSQSMLGVTVTETSELQKCGSLTSVGIRGIKVSDQQNIQNNGDGYGSDPESPHDQLVSFSGADDRIEDCADKKSHNETADVRYQTFFVSTPYCLRGITS